MSQVISINNLIDKSSLKTQALAWVLDRLLGIAKMNELYQLHQMQGLSKEAFADKLIALLKLNITGLDALKQQIPTSGPVVIASNHPFGGIEGVILARAIGEVRPDLKVLANKGLGIFRELKDYFIFTNPLSQKDPRNGPSLRQCISHVKNGKALLLFPAGKVSYYQAQKNAISEHTWNKIVGRLISINDAQYVPVFVSGENSSMFYRIEKVYFRLRMLFLGRELLNKTGAHIDIHTGHPILEKQLKGESFEEKAAFARSLSYAQDGKWRYQWPADTVTEYKPLHAPVPSALIREEINALPGEQTLSTFKGFTVYFAYQHQAPNIVTEIARLRELVFREHNEGSGESIDTDHFDATYTQLFIVRDEDASIIGAYRIGRTDQLIERDGLDGLYLNKMFNFHPEFINRKGPSLELGRSFLIPEYQGSYQGLLLLWRGIGALACKFPQYRYLYGTVSISKLYDPRSVSLIKRVLIQQNQRQHVQARHPFDFPPHQEIEEFCQQYDSRAHLSSWLKSIEADGKDIPILAKQYEKMGAQFHALGIDTSFNHTPGLLLSVDLVKAPTKLLKLYLGEQHEAYLSHHE
ncbi:lysophospholipid acyltransferase family protein [Glaciecola sp. XM2]|uniref:lysophospholipid acyltransferase family protein n=1 Tax=Glaciecola sp. XM2 TaxID=1914931 RepID=UPI001BDE7873|nr:lysophospholipid acyltransferase family protein [Glaciecola sp. XM2]MBT1451188.1 lysophospholipid acyltransferase family protein [Glaciecola sp. XM2]